MSKDFRYRLHLLGSPRLIRDDGVDRTPTSLRARVLLAYLAVMCGMPVERARLQDLAWSTRSQIHGRDSLKKALAEIRRVFAEDDTPQPLRTSGGPVSLSLDRIAVDVLDPETPGATDLACATFLEGVDLPDEPFNEWVAEVRQRVASRPVTPAATGPPTAGSPVLTRREPVPEGLFTLALLPPEAERNSAALASLALDAILRYAKNSGLFVCYDFRPGGSAPIEGSRAPAILLDLRADTLGTTGVLSLHARQTGTGRVINADRFDCELARLGPETVDAFATQAIDRLCESLLRFGGFDAGDHLAARNVLAAIDHIFRLSNGDLEQAESLLSTAVETAPRSAFYGWYAFLSAFQLEKLGRDAPPDLLERTRFLANRALELDRHNPLTAALVGHACCFVLKDMAAAAQVLAPVRQMSDRVALLSDTLAMMHFYQGDYRAARSFGEQASEVGRYHPFRYSFTTSVAMANLMLGRSEQAVANAREALAQHPVIGGHCYEPTMRTLAAACALTGRKGEGRAALDVLRRQDREFSLDRIVGDRDARFPNTEALDVVRRGLEKLDD